ncbi:MAG TPA: pitrilysin family protein [Polyangia bacterium]|nr:pitrilysin family protein [Polyangia bacterium]
MSLAHAALPFASLLFVVPLGGCRSLGGAGKTSQPAAGGTVAGGEGEGEGTTATSRIPLVMGGPGTRAEARLDNGLRVLVEENHAAPVVAVQVWVASGAADDPPALAGAAHLYEHLVFRGTRRRAPGAGEREIEAVGGTVGAWTGLDETVYHATLATPFLELGLDVLADALTAPTFDAAELAHAKKLTAAEIARDAIDPARAASEMLRAGAFPGGAYGRPLLGEPQAVAAFTREALAARFAETYLGANMTVVVVGDVDARSAREAVARAFAAVPRGRPPVHAVASPLPPSTPRALLSTAAGLEAQVALGFRVAAPRPEDAAALDLIAALLTRGSDARLARELADNRQVATAVHGLTLRARGGALVELMLAPAPQRIEAATQGAIDEALRLGRDEVPADELGRVRGLLEGDLARAADGVEGRARRLGFASAIAGDDDDDRHYRDSLEAIDPPALRAAAARLLRPEALTVAVLDPGAPPAAASAERARLETMVGGAAARNDKPPAAAAVAEGVAGGDIVRAVAPSGVRILVLRDRGAPMVAVEAAWAGGARAEDAVSNGAGALIAALLDRGTRTRAAAQIAAELQTLGGALTGFSDRSHFGMRGQFLPGSWSRGVGLLADCLLRPSFPAGEVDGSRRVVVDRARVADSDPAGGARRLFREALWPGHPFRLDPLGSAASLAALGRVRLLDHYRRHYPVSRLVVAVVGDVDPREVVATVTALFAGAPADTRPPEPPPEPVHTEPVASFHTTNKEVAEIVLGYPGAPVRDPDRPALEVLAEVLNERGGPLGRGLATTPNIYRFGASAATGVDPGELAVTVGCAPGSVDAAVAAIRVALAEVAAGGVAAAEVERAARRLGGLRALALRGEAAIADALATDEAYGLPLMSYRRLPAALTRVTATDVARAARRFIDPQRETIAVVRPETSPTAMSLSASARAARIEKGAR